MYECDPEGEREDYEPEREELDLIEALDLSCINPCEAFLRQANPRGLSLIVEGVEENVRFRDLYGSPKSNKMRNLLTYVNVDFEIVENLITIDYSNLKQTGLHFWQTREKHIPIPGERFTVRRIKKNEWSLVEG